MEVAKLDEALKMLDSSLSLIKWRLKFQSKRQLKIAKYETASKPEPSSFLLRNFREESPIFNHLRVMVTEDMLYLIHVRGLAEHVRLSLSSEAQLHFADLEHDPPKALFSSLFRMIRA